MRLLDIKEYDGVLELVSGLHIGAGDTEMRIGGTDNPVVKHPHTNEPYIPGSSIKGKLRMLLELRSGLVGLRSSDKGNPLGLNDYKKAPEPLKASCKNILCLFGISGGDTDDQGEIGPTRLVVGDAFLDEDWKEQIREQSLSFTEIKSENSINRINGTALSPRFMERVVEGAKFRFSFRLKKFENDADLETFLFEGLKLLEKDALGGSGSRGYGRVRFQFTDNAVQQRYEAANPF
ncbi:CRISPR-associated protein, Csm3 family [Desulfobotulus alkaliphilus]|uniref:CRISPR system Cms endoribonuclease Csm3 n=1 Tax=Desulfobotulus alkaliphilus TaxID=622671 RepID=A0A562R6W0_9BACT|nr:type III-A CRISPR-associated RAMP protein Csm3 [Desulfobotulus alkaliphilus]TWI64809.1 CRISPR-associated protein, Csm3 family [Desulfobotulus alkaliphilus]